MVYHRLCLCEYCICSKSYSRYGRELNFFNDLDTIKQKNIQESANYLNMYDLHNVIYFYYLLQLLHMHVKVATRTVQPGFFPLCKSAYCFQKPQYAVDISADSSSPRPWGDHIPLHPFLIWNPLWRPRGLGTVF